jgi:hypothetical protein
MNETEIIIKVAKYGKEFILKVEAQGDYQVIKGVDRKFTIKLRSGKNLIGKQKKNREYIFISSRYFNHCWKDPSGIFSDIETFWWISLTDNPKELIFPYRAGLKIGESSKILRWLWEIKQKQGYSLEIEQKGQDYYFYQGKKGENEPLLILAEEQKVLIDNVAGNPQVVFIKEKDNKKVLFIGHYYSNPNEFYNEHELQPHSDNLFAVDIDDNDLEMLTKKIGLCPLDPKEAGERRLKNMKRTDNKIEPAKIVV